jgi:ABC-2 type transport system permease protein
VTAKELRLWTRDPVRLTCLIIAVVVGIGVGLIPRFTADTGVLMPFGGPLTVLIAGACACNLYGADGTSLWLTVLTPGSARPDVRGRQAAWLLIVAPVAIAETVALTVGSGRSDLWPWALALLIALLGGGAGILALSSLIAVTPLDEGGNPTPAWSLKVHVALVVVGVTAAPSTAVLIVGGSDPSLRWSAVPLGALTAVLWWWWLGRRAVVRLREHQLDVLHTLTLAA